MSMKWEVIRTNTWKLDLKGYTAIIVHDPSTGVFRPCIRKFEAHQYHTVTDLKKAFDLRTAMWRCKHWIRKAGTQ